MNIGVTSVFAIKVKDNRNKSATQIKKISTSRAASLYDINEYVRVTQKKKSGTGVHFKQQGGKTRKHHDAKNYFIICKKV